MPVMDDAVTPVRDLCMSANAHSNEPSRKRFYVNVSGSGEHRAGAIIAADYVVMTRRA